MDITKDCVLRAAQITDREDILKLYRLAADSPMTGWDESYPGDAFIDGDIASDSLFVLMHNNAPVAAITMNGGEGLEQPELWSPARYCVPARLCVRPDLQGRGLGRYMITQMLAWAKEQDFEAVRLLSMPDNAITCRLYESMGFRNVGTIHLYELDFYGFEKLF